MAEGTDRRLREPPGGAGSSEAVADDTDDFVLCSDGTSLRLGEEGVVIRSHVKKDKDIYRCCSFIPLAIPRSKPAFSDRTIKFRDVLWVESSTNAINFTFVEEVNKRKIRPVVQSFPVSENEAKHAQAFAQRVQLRAYGQAQQKKRIKVIINPFGGKGKASKNWKNDIEPIFTAARCEVEVVNTTHSAHAEQIAEELDIDTVDVVACCSGDGVPYEVWNGLGRKKNARAALAKVAVVQLPCGTGNALSVNCNGTSSPSRAALSVVKGIPTRIDLASVTQGEKRTLSFLSLALGIVAECDLDTEHMRWLGDARLTVGFFQRLFRKKVWPCDIAVGVEIADKNDIQRDYRQSFEHPSTYALPAAEVRDLEEDPFAEEGLPPLRYGTVNSELPSNWTMTPFPNLGNFYSGNMPYMAADANFFTFARINEGLLDLVNVRGDIPVHRSVALLLAVGEGKLWQHQDVTYRKVSGFRVIPKQKEGVISVDGEKYPFKPFQVEVHKGLGCTLTPGGRYVRPDEMV
ncbi:uncharacterized protein PV09_02342 [Verruconis gallopava]|uniref:DAGKc domain-containing protein n=1 Tax=Verruconis gallopava TaxID=253628 RepID=A0A0D2AJ97_9PEZI|nr:uncharacterized protein PV09_02342 [Verruconis gallopava]KIW06630.1 hypothetical protein PV09_02342 [Verruconis gallopava]